MRRAALLAVLALAPLLRADGFRPRAAVTYETQESNTFIATGLRQALDMQFSRTVSDYLRYRLGIAIDRYEGTSRNDLAPRRNADALDLRPAAAMSLHYGPVSMRADYSLFRTTARAGDLESQRDLERIAATLQWNEVRHLPSGSLSVRRSRTEEGQRLSLKNDNATASLFYNWRRLTASLGQSFSRQSDGTERYNRNSTGQYASLGYTASFANGKLVATANANGGRSRDTDRTGNRAARIPNLVAVTRAYISVDDTPLVSRDHPLAAAPALTDNRFDVPAGVSLGPDSTSHQTIALDLGRVTEVDEIEINVRGAKNEPLRNGNGVHWDVYTSADGELWQTHNANATSTFDAARSLYEVAFEKVDTRWIKVVSFGVTPETASVTEVQAFWHTVVEGDGRRSSENTSTSLNAFLGFTPIQTLTFTYNGTANRASVESSDRPTATFRDFTHLLSAHTDPFRQLGVDLQYELRTIRTDRTADDLRGYRAAARWMPLQRLTLNAAFSMQEQTLAGEVFDTRSVTADLIARVYPSLDVTLGAGRTLQHRDDGATLSSTFATISTRAQLTPKLRLLLSGTVSESDRSTVPLGVPPGRDQRWNADLDWRLGRSLSLGGAFGWIESDTLSGVSQRYRINWNPFADGTVTLTTLYDQDIDPYSDSRSRRVLVAPRWQINPFATLDLSYIAIATTGARRYESKLFQASLNLTR